MAQPTTDQPPLDLSPACCILVVSSESSLALDLIQKLITSACGTQGIEQDLDDPDNPGTAVEWTIDNKYYSARVHFLAKTPALPPAKPIWPPEREEEQVPAIMFAFADGEEFKQRFLSLKDGIEAHNAEVMLAVRISPQGDDPSPDDSPDVINEFFAEHGFEFVDLAPKEEISDETMEHYDLEGLPRIINALSTIMWPSLVRKGRSPSRLISYLEPLSSTDDRASTVSLGEYPDANDSNRMTTNTGHSLFNSQDGDFPERDLQALEAWLDGDDEAAWRILPQHSDLPDPTSSLPSSYNRVSPAEFEDDFAEFVSALPSHQNATPAPFNIPSADDLESQDLLPSQEEVQRTARRIFGTHATDRKDASDASPITSNQGRLDRSTNGDMGDEPFRFDLGEVLGALQSMKEEVSEIQDADTRRRAAARIALGFAAGLGLPLDEAEFDDAE